MNKNIENSYDVVMIGSSPICSMIAIEHAQKGRKVAIIEKNTCLGGVWRTDEVEGIGEIETACHLIEYYSGSYKKIEKLLGLKFKRMEPQPVKLFSNHKVTPYTNRKSIIFSIAKLFFMLTYIDIFDSMGRLLKKNIRMKKAVNVNRSSIAAALKLNITQRLLQIHKFNGIKSPVDGYSSIPSHIENSCKKNNVEIINGNVSAIYSLGVSDLLIKLETGDEVHSKQVKLSASSIIDKINIKGKDIQKSEPVYKKYWHVLIKTQVCASESIPEYIHLPDNPNFHRITHSASCNINIIDGSMYFLVQLRKAPEEFKNLENEICFLLKTCPLIKIKSQITVKKVYQSMDAFQHDFNDLETKLHLNKSTLTFVPSIGDLGRTISEYFKI